MNGPPAHFDIRQTPALAKATSASDGSPQLSSPIEVLSECRVPDDEVRKGNIRIVGEITRTPAHVPTGLDCQHVPCSLIHG
jgi:hypothetical protein